MERLLLERWRRSSSASWSAIRRARAGADVARDRMAPGMRRAGQRSRPVRGDRRRRAARGGAAADRAACRRRLADHPADRGADRDRRQRRRPAGARDQPRRRAEIARQLRLRRIGGTVVVDFIDLPAAGARARVLAALRDAVADDPAPVQVFPMSRFGLVAISRKRSGPSLAELLGRPCPVCAGAGALPALRWRAEQLIRRWPSGARQREGRRRTRPARLSQRDGQGRLGGVRHPWHRAEARSVACAWRLSDHGAVVSDDQQDREAARGRAARSAAGRARTDTGRSARPAVATSISGAGSARPTACRRSSPATTRTRRGGEPVKQ